MGLGPICLNCIIVALLSCLHRVALEVAYHPEDMGKYMLICYFVVLVPNLTFLEKFNAKMTTTPTDADVFRQVLRLVSLTAR